MKAYGSILVLFNSQLKVRRQKHKGAFKSREKKKLLKYQMYVIVLPLSKALGRLTTQTLCWEGYLYWKIYPLEEKREQRDKYFMAPLLFCC